jgi:hypothetical protein
MVRINLRWPLSSPATHHPALRSAAHNWRMIVLDRWTENLRCPICRKTGTARLSQTDGWNAHADSVPEDFKVVGCNFYCSSDSPVDP